MKDEYIEIEYTVVNTVKIHNKHLNILEALKDYKLQIQVLEDGVYRNKNNFVQSYNENNVYRVIGKYKMNPKMEVFQYEIHSRVWRPIIGPQSVLRHSWFELCSNFYQDVETYNDFYNFQPVWCWNNSMNDRRIGFIYAKKGTIIIDNDNTLRIDSVENIEPITKSQFEKLPFIFDMYRNVCINPKFL